MVAKKKWKMKGCLSSGEWLNKLSYLLVMEHYCVKYIFSFSFIFQFFCHYKECGYKYFRTNLFPYDLFGGINPTVVWLDKRADSLLKPFGHSFKLSSRMIGSIHNSTNNALMSLFCHIPSNIYYFPLLSC